ncbi:MAG: hypothetical protein ACJ8AD_15790, partial [Gemmatimonadaceae bacterium]
MLATALSLVAACRDATAPDLPPTPTSVEVAYCAGREPTWLAFQEGDGAWTQELPTLSGRKTLFHHTFTTNRG